MNAGTLLRHLTGKVYIDRQYLRSPNISYTLLHGNYGFDGLLAYSVKSINAYPVLYIRYVAIKAIIQIK